MEQYFATQREERAKRLLQRLASDEQAAVTRMIEKHAQEMLFMIEEKVRVLGIPNLSAMFWFFGHSMLELKVSSFILLHSSDER